MHSKVLPPSSSGTVIPLLNNVPPPTTNPLQLLRVPYQLIRLDSEVDFPVAAAYLRIVETELGSPRLSRDLIRDCNLCMRFLDSSVGAFASTSLRARSPILEFNCCFFSMCTCLCQPSLLVNAFHGASFLHFRCGNSLLGLLLFWHCHPLL